MSTGNQASWPTLTGNLPVLTGGQHQLVASYSGDASFNASAGTASINVLPGPSRISVDSQDIPALTLNSSQSSFVDTTIYTDLFNGVPPPSGTVSLVRNNNVVSSGGAGGGDGTSSGWIIEGLIPIQASQLQSGLNTFTVQYGGDSNYGPSTAGPVSIDAIAPGGGLALTAPDTVSMNAGTSLTTAITLTPSGGYTGITQWNCGVPYRPELVSLPGPKTHVPLSGPVDTVLVIFASSSTPSGNYTVTLKGNDGTTDGVTISKNITVNVTAAPPALAVMSNGLLNVVAGSTTGNVSAISIIPSDGLTGQVNLSCVVTTSIPDPQNTPTCTSAGIRHPQRRVASDGTGAGRHNVLDHCRHYSVAITATSASNSAVTTSGAVPLTVTPSPSFSLSTTGIVNIFAGASSPNAATLTITPFNGFSGTVSCPAPSQRLSPLRPPPHLYCALVGELDVGLPGHRERRPQRARAELWGFYLMTLSVVDLNSAELGIDATVDVLMGAAPSFSLTNSGTIAVNPGATSGNTSTISVSPANGFTGNVNLTCSVTTTNIVGAKDAPQCSLNPSVVSISGATAVISTLAITTTAATSGAVIPFDKPFRFGARPFRCSHSFFSLASVRNVGYGFKCSAHCC